MCRKWIHYVERNSKVRSISSISTEAFLFPLKSICPSPNTPFFFLTTRTCLVHFPWPSVPELFLEISHMKSTLLADHSRHSGEMHPVLSFSSLPFLMLPRDLCSFLSRDSVHFPVPTLLPSLALWLCLSLCILSRVPSRSSLLHFLAVLFVCFGLNKFVKMSWDFQKGWTCCAGKA